MNDDSPRGDAPLPTTERDQPADAWPSTQWTLPTATFGTVVPDAPPPSWRRFSRSITALGGVAAVVAGLVAAGGWAFGSHTSSPPQGPVTLPRVQPSQPGSITGRITTFHEITTPSRTADGTVVDQKLAAAVLHRYWPVHERALVARDLSTLGRLDTGAARRWQQNAVACGCLNVNTPRPLLRTAYFVPRQTHFPATFVAEGLTKDLGSDWIELLVFDKAAAGAPWLVTEDSGFGPPAGAPPRLALPMNDAAGYTQPVTAFDRQRARGAASAFANVWQRAKDTGQLPSETGFDLTGDTGDRVAYLASHRQDTTQANGLLGHFAFRADKSSPPVAVAAIGYTLDCQPIDETVHYTALSGRSVFQDETRDQWGPGLPPGTYRGVTSRDVWQTCFLIGPASSQPIGVTDHDVGGSRTTPTKQHG